MAETIESLAPWFYEFDLGARGRTTSKLPAEVVGIHQTRLVMVNEAIGRHLSAAELRTASCLDVGCHEGFYSIEAAKRGFASVLGLDVREASLRKARFIARNLEMENVTFRILDAEMVGPRTVAPCDVTLFLGILYHLENPMLCLRNVYSVTKRICVVETQVIDELEGEAEWGSTLWKRQFHGAIALIDESPETMENPETGTTPLVLCPSQLALTSMLLHAGFSGVEYIEPPAGAFEQHARGKRVVAVARV